MCNKVSKLMCVVHLVGAALLVIRCDNGTDVINATVLSAGPIRYGSFNNKLFRHQWRQSSDT
jgi:hypothetical protein